VIVTEPHQAVKDTPDACHGFLKVEKCHCEADAFTAEAIYRLV